MNKVALVTGGSRGIGACVCIELAKNGYSVIINYNNSYDKALGVLEECNKYSDGHMIIKCDMAKEDEILDMVNIVKDKYLSIDLLVNNAAISNDCLIEDKKMEKFVDVLKVNLVGPFILSREISKIMNVNSSIIFVSSTNAIDTYYGYSLDYDASKSGLISIMHNLASFLAPNIRVNAVAPGWVDTDMNSDMDADYKQSEINKILLNRFASPLEIANLILFLASDKASYINNSVIRIDGGVKNE